jgi:hypothetical protein
MRAPGGVLHRDIKPANIKVTRRSSSSFSTWIGEIIRWKFEIDSSCAPTVDMQTLPYMNTLISESQQLSLDSAAGSQHVRSFYTFIHIFSTSFFETYVTSCAAGAAQNAELRGSAGERPCPASGDGCGSPHRNQ